MGVDYVHSGLVERLGIFQGKRIVHLKGFASALDFSDVETAFSARAILERLRALAVDVVVWDGDILSPCSFSRIVAWASRELGASLVAFTNATKVPLFEASWMNYQVTCVLIDDSAPVGEDLGSASRHARIASALLVVPSHWIARPLGCVLCLGGGEVVAEEASLCPAEVTFHVFSCGRWKGVYMERHALAASSGATIALECPLTADEAATATSWFLVSHPLIVKTSLLALAGLGLFAGVPLNKDQAVCDYTGTILTTSEAIRLPDKRYLMRLGPQMYVDASTRFDVMSAQLRFLISGPVMLSPVVPAQVFARYINDPRDARAHNVVFDKCPSRGRAIIRAARFIAPGEELYVDYGKLFWAGATIGGVVPSCLEESTIQDTLARARSAAQHVRVSD